jgi:hypothetical protein
VGVPPYALHGDPDRGDLPQTFRTKDNLRDCLRTEADMRKSRYSRADRGDPSRVVSGIPICHRRTRVVLSILCCS